MSLTAVILVGGLGTRLRPLTDRTRKDMLPLVDRPQLAYTFEHLRPFGGPRAIISSGRLPTPAPGRIHGGGEDPPGPGAEIRPPPDGIDEPFFALNGDSLRETDLAALVDF